MLPLPWRPWPDFAAFRSSYVESRRFYDRDGAFLRDAESERGERAYWLDWAELPELAIAAAIAAEDGRFREHWGIDPLAAGRAIIAALSGRQGGGASTITMQAARLLYGHPRNLLGKLGQMADAIRLDLALEKDAIITLYLNGVSFGGPAVGLEAGSRYWFDKPAAHLSLAETASLIGMIQRPSALDPARHREANLSRRAYVLGRMAATGAITETERDSALAETLSVVRDPPLPLAMHATDWAVLQGAPRGEVRLTIDAGLTRSLERLAAEHAALSPGAGDAAIVVIDNRSMELLAMVGSPDYWAPGDGSVNGAVAQRQPGSTLKPFAYALAFDGALDQGSVLADVSVRYYGADGMLYEPRNHSGEFLGPVTAYEALGRSLNIPALRLVNDLGVETFAVLLESLGLGDYRGMADSLGLGIILGNAETNLLALARAYAVLARGGVYGDVILWQGQDRGPDRRVFSERAVFMVRDILSDERVRMRAFGETNPLMFGFPVAIKTGTSENWRDTWAIGFDDRYTVAVWAGNFDGTPTERLSGSTGAGPLFHKAVGLVLGAPGSAIAGKSPPRGLARVSVCPMSGLLAGPYCPGEVSLYFKEETAPKETCGVHVAVTVDSRDGGPAGADTPAPFRVRRTALVLGPEFDAWAGASGPAILRPPRSGAAPAPVISIDFPLDGDRFLVEPGYDEDRQTLELKAAGSAEVLSVAWYLDGRLRDIVARPFTSWAPLLPGTVSVVAIALGAGAPKPPERLSAGAIGGELSRATAIIRVDR